MTPTELSATAELSKQPVSTERRKTMASKGEAMAGGKFPIADACLTGDTEIALLNGSSVPIRDLVGKSAWVYSFDPVSNAVIPGFLSAAWSSGIRQSMLVTLDDGSTVRCTSNHPFMLRDGTFVPAGELVAGASLMPLYRKEAKTNKKGDSVREHTWQPFYQFWEPTHRMSFRGFHGYLPPKEIAIHHSDHDPFNNEPPNLEPVTQSQHATRHVDRLLSDEHQELLRRGSAEYWARPGVREEVAERMRQENARRMKGEGSEEYRQKLSVGRAAEWVQKNPNLAVEDEVIIGLYAEGKGYKRIAEILGISRATVRTRLMKYGVTRSMKEGAALRPVRPKDDDGRFIQGDAPENHKVLAVAFLPVKEEVFDFTVDGLHNAALSCGVFVHNSDLKRAIKSYGRAKESDRKKVRDHIMKRARALGHAELIPESWTKKA